LLPIYHSSWKENKFVCFADDIFSFEALIMCNLYGIVRNKVLYFYRIVLIHRLIPKITLNNESIAGTIPRLLWRGKLVVTHSLVPEVSDGQVHFVPSTLERQFPLIIAQNKTLYCTRESGWMRLYRNICLKANSKNCSRVAAMLYVLDFQYRVI
jgi:hypothetical protein